MLLVYVPFFTPRVEYTLKLVLGRLGIKYSITVDISQFKNYQFEKLNYSDQRIAGEVFIYANDLLKDNDIKQISVPVHTVNDIKILFPFKDDDIGFDIFSAVFYLISRYEEYLPYIPDKFGRFKATDSIAYKNNFLLIPVVDKWIELLKKTLQKKYPHLTFISSRFKAILTYDIDVAYKYRGRSPKRFIGACLKDLIQLDLKNIYNRFQTLLRNKKDPWDVYEYLQKTIISNKISSVFFFLVGDRSTNDRNLDHTKPVVRHLVNFIKRFADIGLHPSFTTTIDADKIAQEKQRLENIADTKIIKSRQHYLKFHLPKTYKALIKSGITEDYSMCFPETAGFRAGTCKPYNFYDLKDEKETNLTIFPAAFMDGNYIYSSKTKEEALQEINNLIDEIISMNGTFISIWHNHTVSDTADYSAWKNVHDAMITKIISV